jgi:RHS repeat-associated protein
MNAANPNDIYKFTGHERDAEVGLDYMLARNYDPEIGRFLSMDPLARKYPSISPYAYVANNPVNAFDPDGRLVVFINGFPFDGRINQQYWGAFVETIMANYPDEAAIFFNGGGNRHLLPNWLSPNNRKAYGRHQLSRSSVQPYAGVTDDNSRMVALLKTLKKGETIKIVSHSMGAAYARGMVESLRKYLKEVMHLSEYKIDEIIEWELDIAPFNSSSTVLTSNVKNTFQASGNNDGVAGNVPIKQGSGTNVIQVTTPDGTTHDLKNYSAQALMDFIKKALAN